MLAWTLPQAWAAGPPGLELLIWGLCAVFALMLFMTLAAYAGEVWSMMREQASAAPASEFLGFGRAAARVRAVAPRVRASAPL